MKYFLKLIPVIIIINLLTTITGCGNQRQSSNSNVMKEIVKADNLVELCNKIKSDKNFEKDEVDLFTNAVARFANQKDSIVGKTVSFVIDREREFVRMASIQQLQTSAAVVQINFSMSFSFVQLQPVDSDSGKTNVLYFRLTNLSSKNIKNTQGYVKILDAQNVLVKAFPINLTKVFKPGETIDIKSEPYRHDDNNQFDKMIREHPQTLHPVWSPIYLEFEDGLKINVNKPDDK